MSANGRLLAFSQELTKPAPAATAASRSLGYQVRVLATDAAPGPVDGRSRVAASISPQDSTFALPTVLLSPTGTSFYLCTEPFALPKRGSKTITDTPRSSPTDRHREGRPGWSPPGPSSYVNRTGYAPAALSCSSMALDPSGRYLLVPYRQTFRQPGRRVLGRVADRGPHQHRHRRAIRLDAQVRRARKSWAR